MLTWPTPKCCCRRCILQLGWLAKCMQHSPGSSRTSRHLARSLARDQRVRQALQVAGSQVQSPGWTFTAPLLSSLGCFCQAWIIISATKPTIALGLETSKTSLQEGKDQLSASESTCKDEELESTAKQQKLCRVSTSVHRQRHFLVLNNQYLDYFKSDQHLSTSSNQKVALPSVWDPGCVTEGCHHHLKTSQATLCALGSSLFPPPLS